LRCERVIHQFTKIVPRWLRAPQYDEVSDHIKPILLADDLRLDRFKNESMVLRKLSKIGTRMRIATRGSQHGFLVLACLDRKAKKTSFTERSANIMKHL
jgi:hypothetical protein